MTTKQMIDSIEILAALKARTANFQVRNVTQFDATHQAYRQYTFSFYNSKNLHVEATYEKLAECKTINDVVEYVVSLAYAKSPGLEEIEFDRLMDELLEEEP